jgi:hypothetical protein
MIQWLTRMPGLIHCIYTSTATSELTSEQLVTLLQQVRTLNQSHGITGMLLYSERNFFQVLEGPVDVVDQCYARIALDPRHARVTQIIREAITQRTFADWTMGFAEIDSSDLREIDGMNDFFAARSCLDAIDAGRAKKLLAAFAAGRWHATLSGRPRQQKPA